MEPADIPIVVTRSKDSVDIDERTRSEGSIVYQEIRNITKEPEYKIL